MTRICFASALIVCALAAFAEQADPIPPSDALKTIHVPDDVRVELVAAEPHVVDPVALAFDERGRMYVVENGGYPTDDSGKGLVALLEDVDNDGYYETRTVFADGFDFPNGVMPWRGGVLVTCAPNLVYLKDTDNDGRADVREVVLTGFSLGGSTQLRVSHPMLGLDNWIYLTNGLSGGDVTSPAHPDRPAVKMGSLDGRYNPLTGIFETVAGQAQFGQAFDDLGNKFVCSNRKHIEHVVLQPSDLARNPHANLTKTVAEIPDHGEAGRIFALNEARTTAFAHAGTFTAACGLAVYRGDALPEPYRGNAFVCDPTAAIVHRDVLVPSGAGFIAKRGEDGKEFFASTDNWCRPVFIADGPDGALYVCDMYRKTIEHPVYLPEEVRSSTDFAAGKEHGRIYRIIGKTTARTARALDPANTESLLSNLSDRNGWVADTAQRLLLERGHAADAIQSALLQSISSGDAKLAMGRVRLLHLFYALRPDDIEPLAALVAVNDPVLQEHVIRIARARKTPLPNLASLASSESPRVRFALALYLGDVPVESAAEMLAHIAEAGLEDEWTRYAVLSSLGANAARVAELLLRNDSIERPGLAEFIRPLALTLTAVADESAQKDFLACVLERGDGKAPWQLAAVHGMAEGMRRSGRATDRPAAAALAAMLADNPDLASRLDGLFAAARGTVADVAQPLDARITAAELLGFTDFDTSGAVLGELLGPVAPPELQVAAVQSLAQFHDDRIAQYLAAESWGGFTAPVRAAAANALLATPARTVALLDAIERGDVPAWTIDPGARNALQQHRDEVIVKRATTLFADAKSSDRKKVFEEYRDCLTLTPDRVSGERVFKDLCAQCHLYNGVGHDVGPDLTGIRSQPNEAILMHILMPNWLLEQGYENYTIETANFETYSGIIKSQNETTITVKCPLGIEKTIPRANIAAIRTSSKSLMPEELEKGMTKQQLRDLIGFLKGE